MDKNNNKQKEKPLAGISMKIACGSKMALKIGSPLMPPLLDYNKSFGTRPKKNCKYLRAIPPNCLFVLKSAQNRGKSERI